MTQDFLRPAESELAFTRNVLAYFSHNLCAVLPERIPLHRNCGAVLSKRLTAAFFSCIIRCTSKLICNENKEMDSVMFSRVGVRLRNIRRQSL